MEATNDVNRPTAAGSVPAISNVQVRETEEDTIDLVELFYLFLDHMWQIIAVILVGAVLAFTYTKLFITPLYKATAEIYVVSASNNSVVNLSDLQVGSQLTNDYQKLLLIHPLLDEVNSNLDLNLPYNSLAGMIKITNPSNTRLLDITVENPSPQKAAAIANEIARLSTEYLPDIMESAAPHIADAALVPTQKSSPSTAKNVLLGAVGAAVLYCGWLTAAFLMDDTFKSSEDITKYLGQAPIGIIPEAELGKKKTGAKSASKKGGKART